VIHGIRKLARGIHRRSVWQVLAVYLAMSWPGFQGVRWLTGKVGLPEWTPTMALVLLALGLPIVLTTAAVQGGLPWLRMVDVVDPNELEGLTPEQVLVIPEAHPLYGSGIFTWRNAVLGGVMASALLVTSVVSYLTMWALGIGPVGSLVAQGLIDRGDAVLVAEFDNRTDDAALGGVVTDAFRTDLSESVLLSLPGQPVIAQALERMGLDPTTPVTSVIAPALAASEGFKAVVVGDIARTGSGYTVSVRILLPPAWLIDSQFHETVAADEELVEAIDVLSERVRAKFGESLRVIRSGSPLIDLYDPFRRR